MRFGRRKVATGFATAAVALAIAGCGGGDDEGESAPSGADLAAAFEEEAIAAYEAEGNDRDNDFAQGVLSKDCFLLDEEGAAAVGEALGATGAQTGDTNFLVGFPGEEERITCGLTEGGEGAGLTIGAGTTLADPEQTQERLLRADGAQEIDGEAPGLDPASVAAVEANATLQLVWVDEDFSIGIGAPAAQVDPEQGFEALSVAVDEVARTLEG